MVIDPESADTFIAGYKMLLSEAHRLAGGRSSPNLLRTLASGREAVRANPELLGQAVACLEESGERLSSDVRRAMGSLRLRQWVYLKDTTKYSIFIAPEENEAFGVVGLTDRIRNILGGAAVTFRAGVVEYQGKYVCDGILESHMWLGPNYKREYNSMFAALKREGRFRVACEP